MKSSKNTLNGGGDRIFMTLVYVIAVFAFVVTLYPFVYVVAVSFSGSQAVYQGKVFLWPVEPTLAGYQQVLKQGGLWTAYGN
ncbi:MAG: carbohydrate ABC transporter permease, partial [Clostridia bacterium]|nr:carbohydrate ABC transporter permease [Clostridia bacterium]